MPETRCYALLVPCLVSLFIGLSLAACSGRVGDEQKPRPTNVVATATPSPATPVAITPTPQVVSLSSVSWDEVLIHPLYIANVDIGEIIAVGKDKSSEPFELKKWLPDGRLLVTSGKAMFALDLDRGGLLTKLWEGDYIRSVSVSPDGELAAIVTSGNPIVVATDGSGVVSLLDNRVGFSTWSPDSRWLAWAVPPESDNASSPPTVMVAERNDLTVPHMVGGAFVFAWSPDFPLLALVTKEEVILVDVASGEERVHPFPEELSAILNERQAWLSLVGVSPGSDYLALDVLFMNESRGADESVFVLPLNGQGGVEFSGARSRGWLPGKETLIITGNICSNREELLLVTVDGGVQRDLGRFEPIILPSPDGDRLAVVARSKDSPDSKTTTNTFRVVDLADGGESTLLSTSDAPIRLLAWSPDSTKVAFTGSGGFGWCEGGAAQTLEISPLQ